MLGIDLILKTLIPKFFLSWGGGGDDSSSSAQSSPSYIASEYDAPSAKTIYEFYEPRTRGENLGYSKEDLSTMQGQAIDQSTRVGSELERRGSAGRRLGYGGTTTGGTNVMREKAIQTGLEYRSNALRDIAIKNAVQKHQDQWNAASGLQNFLNAERSNALSKWTGDVSMYNANALADTYAGSQSAGTGNALMSAGAEIGGNLLQQYLSKNLFKTNQGPTSSVGSV